MLLPFTKAVVRAANGGGQAVLNATLLEALALLSSFDATFLSVVDREQNRLTVTSAYAPEGVEVVPVGTSVEIPPDFPERAFLGVTHSSDGKPTSELDSRIARALGMRTFASVPIMTADFRLHGMLCGVSRAALQVSDDVIALMEYFSRIIIDQMARDVARADDLSVQVQRLLEEVAADVRTRDMHPVVKDLVEEARMLVNAFNAAGGGHRVRLEPAIPRLHAQLDPALFVQIMAHLLDNAVKYSDPDSTIEVDIRPHNGHGAISVRDEGIGLPPGIDVFAPFQRGHNEGAAASAGVGLGLHIVRNLAHAMGGEVTAENNPDRGATFTVTLPTTDPASLIPTQPAP